MDNDDTLTVDIPDSRRVTITKSLWPVLLIKSRDNVYIEIRERINNNRAIIIAGRRDEPIAGRVISKDCQYLTMEIRGLLHDVTTKYDLSENTCGALHIAASKLIDSLPPVNID